MVSSFVPFIRMAFARDLRPSGKYRVSGQARIFVDGRYFNLGPYGSAEA